MIPSDFIEDLLSKVDIVDVIGRYIKLKKRGQNYVACCPFHKENTPSFTVSSVKQFYHCFGCGASGTAITFLMKYSGLSFLESIELLSSDVGLVVPRIYVSNQKLPELGYQEKEKKRNLEQILQRISFFYLDQLKSNIQAQDYLYKKRGLSKEICDKFLLGYSSFGVVDRFRDCDISDLVESGIVKKDIDSNRFYDYFRHRVMFPIKDIKNKIIGFGGRVLDGTQPKYLNSPETLLFSKSKVLYGLNESMGGIRDNGKVLVVEGYMDVISLFDHGINYVVATLGTFTSEDHIKLLFRQSDRIYFCFDGDKAGRLAAWKALESSLSYLADGKFIYFLFLDEGYDPDSYIREHGRDSFENLLNKSSIILSEYLISYLSEGLNLDFDEDKSKLIEDFSNLILRIKNINLRYFLMEKLSNKIKIEFFRLEGLINSKRKGKVLGNNNHLKAGYSKIIGGSKLSISTLVERLILMLLINPHLSKYIDIPEFINLDEELSTLVGLSECIKSLKNCNTAQIIESMRGSNFYNLINRVFINSKGLVDELNISSIDDENVFLEGFNKIRNRINLLQLGELKDLMKFRDLTFDESKLLLSLSKRDF